MSQTVELMNEEIAQRLITAAKSVGLDISGGTVRRSSSRFCLGVEHGDYNGMELFGVGTNRFIWMAYKPNTTGRVRIFSENFPGDGLVDFALGEEAPAGTHKDSWARFPMGAAYILRKNGYPINQGFDAVVYGNIPGGGMSRSASLCLNLLLTLLEVNDVSIDDGMQIVDLAQMVENQYIGSPCGKLDQLMIYFAREGMGAHYNPKTNTIEHIPFGGDAEDFRIVSLDTGTKRPGLEKSTYRIRRDECRELTKILEREFGHESIARIRSKSEFAAAVEHLQEDFEHLQGRLKYLFEANQRFGEMLNAWREGDIAQVGAIFRADGIGLRDDYEISGRELETMCNLARTVEGVYGERMLGGGDKGASGAIVRTDAFSQLKEVVNATYPVCHPDYADSFAIHACKSVDGIRSAPAPF
ncbi:MAG: hypothetical protein AAFX93_18855 [Verrucomicrobiota bacterium]